MHDRVVASSIPEQSATKLSRTPCEECLPRPSSAPCSHALHLSCAFSYFVLSIVILWDKPAHFSEGIGNPRLSVPAPSFPSIVVPRTYNGYNLTVSFHLVNLIPRDQLTRRHPTPPHSPGELPVTQRASKNIRKQSGRPAITYADCLRRPKNRLGQARQDRNIYHDLPRSPLMDPGAAARRRRERMLQR